MKLKMMLLKLTAGMMLFLCCSLPVLAQDIAEVESSDPLILDASSLSVGSPFSINVDISSDEQLSFSASQSSLSAQLCPLEKPDECQKLSLALPNEDATMQRGTLSVSALPYAGDYNLSIVFNDVTGTFLEKRMTYLLQGVKEASDIANPTTVITPTFASTIDLTAEITPTIVQSATPEATVDAKELLYHQVVITDSNGNAVCSDSVACGLLYGDDLFTLTYSLPATWAPSPLAVATVPDALGQTTVTWPQDWADAIRLAESSGLLNDVTDVCQIDENNQSTLNFTFVEGIERYSTSCRFMVGGNLTGQAETLSIHNENKYFNLADLALQLPASLVKRDVSITPFLQLRMTVGSEPTEQISGGSVSRLYRTINSPANTSSFGNEIATYTLGATLSGIPASRTPQTGDAVLVTWDLLNKLKEMGDLPACFVPHDIGVFQLGSLSQNPDGSWSSSCELRFPSILDEYTASGAINLQFVSSAYETSATVGLPSLPFSKEQLTVNLSVPSKMRLLTDYTMSAQLSSPEGGLSQYARALLNAAGGGMLNSIWDLNAYTDCYGVYQLDMEGTAACHVRFDAPNMTDTVMSFNFSAPGTENLMNVIYSPAEIFAVPAISRTQATLTTELYHAGTQEILPAALDAEYKVLDSYQLKFRLTPDSGYEDVIDNLSLDSEGYVTNWDHPLLLQWAILPGGSQSLNFIKDGAAFEARYDFSFEQGDADLSGAFSQLYISVNIPGWDINLQPADQPLQLPTRISKQGLRLYFADLYDAASGQVMDPVRTGQEARVDLFFEGNIESFVPALLQVTQQQDGIDTALECDPFSAENKVSCRLMPMCSDVGETSYPAICSGDIQLRAVYAGDAVNAAAEAEAKFYHVERSKIIFEIPQSGNLDNSFMKRVEAATEDMSMMDYGSVSAGSWDIDSYLTRETRDRNGRQYQSYPISFTYSVDGAAIEPQWENFVLDVTIETGDGDAKAQETFSIKPQSIDYGSLSFALDFDSAAMLDDGRIVRDVLAKAMTIKELQVRYTGDPAIAQSSRVYEMEGLTFALKVVTEIETELDNSIAGQLRFGGILGNTETLMQTFRVYCSQLAQPLHCYEQDPLSYSVDFSQFSDADADGIDDIAGEALPPVTLPEEGCWGRLTTLEGVNPLVYVSPLSAPKCYLMAVHDAEQIWLGTNY